MCQYRSIAGVDERGADQRLHQMRSRIVRLILSVVAAFALTLATLAPALSDDVENFKTVEGLSVYLGIMPAAIVKGHPPGHAEAEMHGGAPSGPHAYHIVVAIFEAGSGNRVENAEVAAVVSGLGHIGGTNLQLEPMSIEDTITYGAFIDLRATERFEIGLTINVPGKPGAVHVNFESEHLP